MADELAAQLRDPVLDGPEEEPVLVPTPAAEQTGLVAQMLAASRA
jgi:hypothetical protein